MNADPADLISEPHRASLPAADSPSASPADLRAALAAQRDQYLRLAADFENFRKRTRRDSERQAAAGRDAFIHDLLPVADDLERALGYEQTRDVAEMALRQLGQLLSRHGIEAVKDVGRPFDPERHEAVMVRNDPVQPDHVVLEVTRRGYCRGDEVFRPAHVIVNDLRHSPGASRRLDE